MARAPEDPDSRLAALLEGVHPDWVPFLEENGLTAAAAAALATAESGEKALAPPPPLVFEFLRYFGPADTKVVIMGQDPYPQDAQGVCFSVPARAPLTASLKPVIANLENHRLALPHYREKGDAASGRLCSGDLRCWAAQGVLLMNAALTTRAGTSRAHKDCWSAFTRGFLRALAARATAASRRLVFMLWGNDARAFAGLLEGEHLVYEWTHPSPLSDNRLPAASRFVEAPHFADANAALLAAGLRPIQWDPLGFTYAFTDGSCPRNGADDAEAAFAVFVLTGPLKNVRVRGRVAPCEYALADPEDPLRGFVPVRAGPRVTPTNNRGEYLAWCWVFLLLLRGRVCGRVEVVSDCNLFIQTMRNWLPARRAKGTAEGLKNFDLVCIAERLYEALRAEVPAVQGVELTHVHSHQKRPPAEAGPRAQVFWYGNGEVDRAAGELLADPQKAAVDLEFEGDAALEWRLTGVSR